jgi:uncharacterized protein YajQ (UPF0234 family)
MAQDHSFDIVSKVDMQEVLNAVTQANKEMRQRFDFKGSKSNIDLSQDKAELTIVSDDEQKLKSVVDILENKFIKRKVSLKSLSYDKIEQAGGNTVRQIAKLQQGISTERAKELVKMIKNMKMKVQSEIQKDQVRVKAKKIDDLQTVMGNLKEKEFEYHMEFINYR